MTNLGATVANGFTWDQLQQIGIKSFGFTIPSVVLTFIKDNSDAELLAKPQLRIAEGQKAQLLIGDRVPIPVSSFNTSNVSGSNVVPVTSYQYQDIGIKIEVEPRVHHNKEVTLKLMTEVSNISGYAGVATGQQPQPIIGTRTISSNIRLRDGETNFLAGLYRTDKSNARETIPFIGDIPILGRIFSKVKTDNQTTDLVLTLTPHIIRIPDITEEDLTPVYVGTDANISYQGGPRVENPNRDAGPFEQQPGGRPPIQRQPPPAGAADAHPRDQPRARRRADGHLPAHPAAVDAAEPGPAAGQARPGLVERRHGGSGRGAVSRRGRQRDAGAPRLQPGVPDARRRAAADGPRAGDLARGLPGRHAPRPVRSFGRRGRLGAAGDDRRGRDGLGQHFQRRGRVGAARLRRPLRHPGRRRDHAPRDRRGPRHARLPAGRDGGRRGHDLFCDGRRSMTLPVSRRSRRREAGFTMVEVAIVAVMVAILAGMVIPVARYSLRRQKELELKHQLRTMREAIDKYKQLSDAGLIPLEIGGEGFPPDLETLAKGVDLVGQVKKKQRFIRKLPIDPMTGKAEWGLRSYQDEPDSFAWGGQNVYDIYSLSPAKALDGTYYKDW